VSFTFGGVAGLRYEGVAAKLAKFPELDQPGVWDGLEVIEQAFVVEHARRQQQRERQRGR
jgi:hypothetical protein